MRSLILVPFCLAAAACGGAEEPKKKEEAAKTMEAGQWETVFEVTSHRSTDGKTPVVKAKAGDRTTAQTCIGEAEKAKPSPALFAGEGYECQYKSSHISGGRILAELSCNRPGTKGEILMTVDGDYTATGFTGTVTTNSFLPGDGDFFMSSKMTGRKTGGTCQAEAPVQEKSGGRGG